MIVAASSLYLIVKDLELEERRETQQKVYAVSGLSLSPNTMNRRKNLRILLEQEPLASKQIILWHDVLNNSISSHRTNNYTPCPLDELLAYLQSKRRQISAIVYCRRTGTPNIFEDLRKTEKIFIKTTGNIISRSKRQNPAVLREYLQLHQSRELELKSLRVLLSHRDHLPGIFSKIRAQTKKSSQGKGTESEGVGWGPSAGAKRPISGKILMRLFFNCGVPHEFNFSWPAKKR